jgi:hypothetical protein
MHQGAPVTGITVLRPFQVGTCRLKV